MEPLETPQIKALGKQVVYPVSRRSSSAHQAPCRLMGFVHVQRLACHDGIDAASVGSLPLRQKVNPGLHGAVALGLGDRIVRRQFLRRGLSGLAG
jgi:hypothetical protein